MERLKEYDKKPQSYNYEEELKDYTGIVYWSGEEYDAENNRVVEKYVRAGYVTDEVIAEVDRIIDSAEASYGGKLSIDPAYSDGYSEIYDIYNEEIEKLFEGEYTPEHCAEVLQSRLSIYMSENYG